MVDASIALGIYVIIDWHILSDNDPNQYKSQARAFFQDMAGRYAGVPNVLYELCNEPNGGSVQWQTSIKPYAQEIASAIRAIDRENIIIVGTPTWSQDVNAAADSPLAINNVMYSLHFYAGTHGSSLRNKADYALSKGIALFVTEWGTSSASGGGGVFLPQAQEWMDFLATRQISWVNWSLCDKSESSAALNPGASPLGGWSDSQLSQSGLFVKQHMR